jgi:hypothetical protein
MGHRRRHKVFLPCMEIDSNPAKRLEFKTDVHFLLMFAA